MKKKNIPSIQRIKNREFEENKKTTSVAAMIEYIHIQMNFEQWSLSRSLKKWPIQRIVPPISDGKSRLSH